MLSFLGSDLKSLLVNPILLSCVSSWFCAQFIKTVINILYGRIHGVIDLLENLLWRTGGMPSSHSAMVVSLTTSIGFKDGINSDIFILALCFLMVTIRDAVGVRRASGLQAHKLNIMGKQLAQRGVIPYTPLKEVRGHTPLEVTIGCLLGFFIALSFSLGAGQGV